MEPGRTVCCNGDVRINEKKCQVGQHGGYTRRRGNDADDAQHTSSMCVLIRLERVYVGKNNKKKPFINKWQYEPENKIEGNQNMGIPTRTRTLRVARLQSFSDCYARAYASCLIRK